MAHRSGRHALPRSHTRALGLEPAFIWLRVRAVRPELAPQRLPRCVACLSAAVTRIGGCGRMYKTQDESMMLTSGSAVEGNVMIMAVVVVVVVVYARPTTATTTMARLVSSHF